MNFILKNWSIETKKSTKYTAPELNRYYLTGYVYGHPEYPDHHPITTSHIVDYDVTNRIITTASGSKYKLDKPSKKYKEFVKKNNPDWKYRELLEWSEDK